MTDNKWELVIAWLTDMSKEQRKAVIEFASKQAGILELTQTQVLEMAYDLSVVINGNGPEVDFMRST